MVLLRCVCATRMADSPETLRESVLNQVSGGWLLDSNRSPSSLSLYFRFNVLPVSYCKLLFHSVRLNCCNLLCVKTTVRLE